MNNRLKKLLEKVSKMFVQKYIPQQSDDSNEFRITIYDGWETQYEFSVFVVALNTVTSHMHTHTKIYHTGQYWKIVTYNTIPQKTINSVTDKPEFISTEYKMLSLISSTNEQWMQEILQRILQHYLD